VESQEREHTPRFARARSSQSIATGCCSGLVGHARLAAGALWFIDLDTTSVYAEPFVPSAGACISATDRWLPRLQGLDGRIPVKGQLMQRFNPSGLILVRMAGAATGVVACAIFALLRGGPGFALRPQLLWRLCIAPCNSDPLQLAYCSRSVWSSRSAAWPWSSYWSIWRCAGTS
jgi:hypothetical protein